MSADDGKGVLADLLGLPLSEVAAFAAVALSLDLTPEALIGMLVARVVMTGETMKKHGLPGIGFWHTRDEAVSDVLYDAMKGLPVGIRETGFMWPADKPFPWTAEECRAAVIGYSVRWTGDFDDFVTKLRGLWEMSDGYAFLLQR